MVLVHWSLEGHFHIGWYFCIVTLVPEVLAGGAIVAAIVAVVLVESAVGTVILVIFIFLVIWIIILTFIIGVMDVLSLIDLKFLVVTTDINVVDFIDILGVDSLRYQNPRFKVHGPVECILQVVR